MFSNWQNTAGKYGLIKSKSHLFELLSRNNFEKPMYFVQKTYVFELKNHGFLLKKHRFFKIKVPKRICIFAK